jgi:hypothetical protein
MGTQMAHWPNSSRHSVRQAPLKPPIEPARWFLSCALCDDRAGKIPLRARNAAPAASEMNQMALSEAAATTTWDVTHAHQQFDATRVVTLGEGQ